MTRKTARAQVAEASAHIPPADVQVVFANRTLYLCREERRAGMALWHGPCCRHVLEKQVAGLKSLLWENTRL